jgi:hypothetical protein
MLKILVRVLVGAAFIGGGILAFTGHSKLGGTIFLLGVLGAGFLLPPGNHDTTGGASDC